jgi:hypothetical protein
MIALSSLSEILSAAAAHGVKMTPAGDKLRLKAPKQPPADLLAAIDAHKPAILAALSVSSSSASRTSRWSESLARLRAMPYPADIEVDRWALFLNDCEAFCRVWGEQAERTGWQASDLFAVPGGLCWQLDGREGVALSIQPELATIRAKHDKTGPGATSEYRRPVQPQPLPWAS